MDNVTAVKKGGTVSKTLCQLAITIWTWCSSSKQNTSLGQLNSQANEESRTARDHCDWKLKPSVFQQIEAALGPLEVGLFGSCLTKQIPRFYSWRPDPEAEATDTFLQNWAAYQGRGA